MAVPKLPAPITATFIGTSVRAVPIAVRFTRTMTGGVGPVGSRSGRYPIAEWGSSGGAHCAFIAPWRIRGLIGGMATDTLLTGEILQKAFDALDEALPGPVDLVVGGGTAMMLAYRIPVRTTDVDAYPVKMTPSEPDPYVKQVARKQKLPGDWLNPHYATFAHVLPPGYSGRLRDVFVGKKLRARALGPKISW